MKNLNANTAKSTGTWVKRFSEWRMEKQIGQEISKKQLDGILQLFFAEIHKINYELDSLKTTMATLDRHLQEKGSTCSILKD